MRAFLRRADRVLRTEKTVYNNKSVWYNRIVKRLGLACVTTALVASAALGGGISVGAAAAETQYPQSGDFVFSLSFSDLKDYAVSDGAFAFVDGNTVKVYDIGTLDESGDAPVYKNGTLTEYGDFEVTVTSVDFVNGSFYYSDGNGKVYSLSDKAEAEGVTVTAPQKTLYHNDYLYTVRDNCIRIVNAEAENTEDMTVEIEGGFSGLKLYGENVYAIKDGGIAKFTGGEMLTAEMQYVDFSPAETIAAGNAAQELKDYTLTFVNVAEGSFMTEIDLSSPLTDYFKLPDKKDTTAQLEEETFALLLGYSGNAAIISIGKKSYITLKTNVTESGDGSEYFTQAEFTKAQLLGNAIYASPFVMGSVYALYPATGAIVKVTGKIHHEVLEADFYKVEYSYENNGQTQTVKGYVNAGLLTGDNVNDNAKPTENPDENYTEKNDVRTVLIVLMVVILVLIVISYLAWIGTSGRRGKGKKSDDK